jgi:hypothetical protein
MPMYQRKLDNPAESAVNAPVEWRRIEERVSPMVSVQFVDISLADSKRTIFQYSYKIENSQSYISANIRGKERTMKENIFH